MQKNCAVYFQEICKLEISGISGTLEQVRKIGGKPLSSFVVKTETGADKSAAHHFVKLCILWLCEFFGTTWNDLQIREAAKQLYENYYFWTGADWKLFINRCASGYYGKVFGSFSPAVMMDYAAQYNSEWMELSAGTSLHDSDLIKKTDEKERDYMAEIERRKEERIHRSAVEEFKSAMMKNKLTPDEINDAVRP